jgi:CRISPR-associated protein Cas1
LSPAAKAHPLSVFQAIIKSVTSSVDPTGDPHIFFHIKDRRHTFKIRELDRINLEIFFCHKDAAYVDRWQQDFRDYLTDQKTGRNFDIVELGDVEERDFNTLLSETGALPEEGELCLEFLTPLPFTPAKGRDRTFLSKPQFIELFEKRFQKLFGVEVPYRGLKDDFRLLPYYWNYTEIRHPSASQPGHVQYINGCTGKLYLKGRWCGLLPFLILGSEIHAGSGITYGRGYYRIHAESPGYFSGFFPNKKAIISVVKDIIERYDDALESLSAKEQLPFNEEAFAEELYRHISSGTYTPSPNTAFFIKKQGGTERMVEQLGFRDLILQQYILKTISEPFDRMFEECSIGFRKGISRQRAAEMIHKAIQEGYTYVLESDIEDFFPSVDHSLLMQIIDYMLPSKDACLKDIIKKCICAGYVLNGVYHERTRGLAQGSPLSPMLANLYLDSFDEEVQTWNVKLIRYGDDFIIMARSREDAEAVLSRAESLLSFLGLRIKKEKTAIKHFRDGFDFLGMTFTREGEQANDEWARLFKKPLYITEPYLFLALNGDAIEIKKNKEVIETIPLRRISEIMVMEKTVFSTALLARCCESKIPFTIALNSGYYITTVKPDSKNYYEVSSAHTNKYANLSETEILCIAKEFAAGKLKNYIAMFRQRHEKQPATAVDELQFYIQRVYLSATIDQVRGFEAAATKKIYQMLNNFIDDEFFHIRKRARKKPDAINSLLNLGYYLLFSRINATVRAAGLNPYLGFLHNPGDSYESLVCDIEELFRSRIDRLIIRMVNLKVVKKEDFIETDRGCYLKNDAVKKFIKHFEAEMIIKSKKNTLSVQEGIYAQVMQIKKWAVGNGSISFYEFKP